MGCKECGKPKCNGECGCKSPKVLQINNPAEYITFHKVSIPAAMGDSTTNPPKIGAYRNALVYYEADHTSWMYSTDGIPTKLTNGLTDYNEAVNLPQINGHTLIGDQSSSDLGLQGGLTAGANIQINGNVISATDTTYTAGNGIELDGTEIKAKIGDGLEFDNNGEIDISNIEQYARFFDTVADMQSATNLVNGSFAKTLGYHSLNDGGAGNYKIRTIEVGDVVDGGSLIAMNDNTLVAELIIKDNEVNVKQFGAKGDGTTDDTAMIQACFDSNADVFFVPEGNYKITEKLTLPLNKTIKGTDGNTCIFKVTDFEDYAIQYGTSYNYGAKRGKIEDIRIEPLDDTNNSSYGIYLYSGCEIRNVYFNKLKQAVTKTSRYIDNIVLYRCHFMYCGGKENSYVVDLPSNGDSIRITQCQFGSSYTNETYSDYLGIRIMGSTSFLIDNNIINVPITLTNCKGTLLTNHMEGPSTDDHFNLGNIKIVNSNVDIDTLYIFKCYNKPEIEIQNESPFNEVHACTVSLKNVIVALTSQMVSGYQDMSAEYNIFYGLQSVLNIENCFNQIDFTAGWGAIFPTTGLVIKDGNGFMDAFNNVSSLASIKSTISSGKVYIDEMKPVSVNATNNSLQYSSSTDKIAWFESGFSASSVFYKRVTCYDWDRKLIASTSSEKEVTNITSYQNDSSIGRGAIIGNVKSFTIATSGAGLLDVIYRGSATGSYDKVTKVPMCAGRPLHDFGTHIAGHPTENRTAGDIDTFTTVTNFRRIGDNVEFTSNSTPAVGTFVKGDKCLRSTISAGGNIGWIYNGSNWISLGTYPS